MKQNVAQICLNQCVSIHLYPSGLCMFIKLYPYLNYEAYRWSMLSCCGFYNIWCVLFSTKISMFPTLIAFFPLFTCDYNPNKIIFSFSLLNNSFSASWIMSAKRKEASLWFTFRIQYKAVKVCSKANPAPKKKKKKSY